MGRRENMNNLNGLNQLQQARVHLVVREDAASQIANFHFGASLGGEPQIRVQDSIQDAHKKICDTLGLPNGGEIKKDSSVNGLPLLQAELNKKCHLISMQKNEDIARKMTVEAVVHTLTRLHTLKPFDSMNGEVGKLMANEVSSYGGMVIDWPTNSSDINYSLEMSKRGNKQGLSNLIEEHLKPIGQLSASNNNHVDAVHQTSSISDISSARSNEPRKTASSGMGM